MRTLAARIVDICLQTHFSDILGLLLAIHLADGVMLATGRMQTAYTASIPMNQY